MKKHTRRMQDNWLQYRVLCIGVVALFFVTSVNANPVLNNVAAGNVSIQQTSNTTVVNQTSQQAIINWQSFNIGSQEATHFQQPAGGSALNRISSSQGASSIYGVLTATGQIILINPAGIYFGPSAYVNVGAMIATSANMTDQNYLNGHYQFTKVTGYSGSIINAGEIIAANNGLIALVGANVTNSGLVQANLGHVVLASADAFTINFAGNDLINFTINAKTSTTPVDQNGHPLSDGVDNTGTILANGGSVLITAQAVQGVLDNVINMQGITQTQSVGTQNGEIILSGDTDAGVVRVAGTLDASGKGSGQTGGNVEVTGYDILIDTPALINVSGDAGGGNIYVGGNEHGAGPLPNANATVIAPGASLLADAITTGNGGNIIEWSDNVTKAYGYFSAQGGAESGNGGFIETSSENYLDMNGASVNTTAAHGTEGTWLLDPADVVIENNGGTDSDITFAGTTYTPTVGASASIIDVGNLVSNLGTSSVDVTTTSTGGGTGSITVLNNIIWNSAHSLTLTPTISATANIFLDASIENSGTGSINFEGPVVLGHNVTVSTAATSGVGILFASTIDGAFNLNLNENGFGGEYTQIVGAVGSITPLTSIVTNNGLGGYGDATVLSGNVTTTGNQTWGTGFNTLNNDIVIAGDNIIDNEDINGAGPFTQQALTINSNSPTGSVTFSSPILSGSLTSLTIGPNGTTYIDNGAMITSANQIYNNAVTSHYSGFSLIISSTSGRLTFNSTLDGDLDYQLSSTQNVTIVGAIGSITPLNSLKTIGPTELDGGSVTTVGLQNYIGALTLGANTTFNTTNAPVNFADAVNSKIATTDNLTTDTGSGNVTFSMAVGNTQPLGAISFVTSGTINLLNNVTAGSLITVAGSTIDFDLSGLDFVTTGNQTYNGLIQLSANATLTLDNTGTIAINAGETGNHNLTLNGASSPSDSFIIRGALGANNVTVVGGGGTNTLQVASGNPEQWNIAGANSGNITGTGATGVFGFTNVQNLTGGMNGNAFVFANGATVAGTINGGSLSSTNSLNYLAYTTPITVSLLGTNSGTTTGSGLIDNFANINNLLGNGLLTTTLTLPNTQNTLVLTAPQSGFLSDPLSFSGFSSFVSSSGTDIANFTSPAIVNPTTGAASMSGTPMTFTNFSGFTGDVTIQGDETTVSSANVSAVLQQSNSSPAESASDLLDGWSLTSNNVTNNLLDLANEQNSSYLAAMNSLKINLNCD